MPMIFPGMDPYLENPRLWPGLHHRLIVYLAERLQPDLRPRHVASIQERVFLEGDADLRLDLQAVLNGAYEAGSFQDLIDYRQPCLPPLSAEDQRWASERIAAARAAGK